MSSRRTLIQGLAAAALAPPALMPAAQAQAGFKPLYDGRSLSGWTPIGDAVWSIREGALYADQGATGFLISQDSYRDYDLIAEFWVSPDANSGVFLRCSDRTKVNATNAYEVNIFDTRPDPSYGTGSIVNVAKVSPMPKAGGRWNVFEISAKGDTFSVTLNGQKTVDKARDGAHADGPIALQHGAGVVKFRKVAIRTA